MSTENLIPLPEGMWSTDLAVQERVEANRVRAEDKGLEPCEICGRGVAVGKGWVIEVADGGAAVVRPGTADVNDPGYMGSWVLGPECGKHVPAEFRTKYTGWED